MNFALLLQAVLLSLIGAFVAGLSAVAKTAYERRDARRNAQKQLELASSRTEFIKDWLTVSRSLDDAAYAKEAAVRARDELERAYADATHALESGQEALDENWGGKAFGQVKQLLMLVPRRRKVSYAVVVAFYVWVLAMSGLLVPDQLAFSEQELAAGREGSPFWRSLLIFTVVTIVARVVAGWAVHALESRAQPSA